MRARSSRHPWRARVVVVTSLALGLSAGPALSGTRTYHLGATPHLKLLGADYPVVSAAGDVNGDGANDVPSAERSFMVGPMFGLFVTGFDGGIYAVRFTPRRPRSPWSARNREAATELIRERGEIPDLCLVGEPTTR